MSVLEIPLPFYSAWKICFNFLTFRTIITIKLSVCVVCISYLFSNFYLHLFFWHQSSRYNLIIIKPLCCDYCPSLVSLHSLRISNRLTEDWIIENTRSTSLSLSRSFQLSNDSIFTAKCISLKMKFFFVYSLHVFILCHVFRIYNQ